MTNDINGINGTNGINGCFIPPIAQGRAKSPCVGADFIYSPGAMGGVKFYGSIWNAPLRHPQGNTYPKA